MKKCKHCGNPLILSGGKCLYCGKAPERDDGPSESRLLPVKVFTVNGVSFKMILVEGGSFFMGVTPQEAQRYINEGIDWRKKHPIVKLDSYYIGETEVTQALWKAVMNDSSVSSGAWRSFVSDMNNPSKFKGDGLPVDNVSWNNCHDFLDKLTEISGVRFRLPSEAEWEFASKGGVHSKGYEFSGSNDLSAVAWTRGSVHAKTNPESTTHPVKTKLPNELGLYDMTGNVWEWCEDGFDEEYIRRYGENRGGEVTNPDYYPRGKKILRGFSAFKYFDDDIMNYPSHRNYQWPNARNPSLYDNGATTAESYDAFGFRLALSVGNQ